MATDTLRLRCACGWEMTGPEDELVAATQEHGRRMHNMSATREEVLAMVIRGDSVAPADTRPSGDTPPERANRG